MDFDGLFVEYDDDDVDVGRGGIHTTTIIRARIIMHLVFFSYGERYF